MDNKKIAQYFENIIKDNPKSLVFARLASIYLEQGRIDDAINLLEQGIQTYPSYVTGHFILAKAYIAKNQREKAEEALKKVISHDRLYLHAHKLLGDLMARIGWENKAAIHYRDIIDIDPLDEETEQMLDTFSFSVKPPEGKKISSGKKEKDWISGTPPIFERSAKVSQKKQELNKETDKTSSSATSELDLSEFDLDKFSVSENGQEEKPIDSAGRNKHDTSYTGELDLSDIDLEEIAIPPSDKNTGNLDIEDTINKAEQLLNKKSGSESTSEKSNKTSHIDEILLPDDESKLTTEETSSPNVQEDLQGTNLEEIVDDINHALSQESETEEPRYEENELDHLKDILLPDDGANAEPEGNKKHSIEPSDEKPEEPLFEEGFLSNITGTTEHEDQDIVEPVSGMSETSSKKRSDEFFADEEPAESGISNELFKDEDSADSTDESKILVEDEKPEIEDLSSDEEFLTDDIVSQIQEEPSPAAEDIQSETTATITEGSTEIEEIQELSPETSKKQKQDTLEKPETIDIDKKKGSESNLSGTTSEKQSGPVDIENLPSDIQQDSLEKTDKKKSLKIVSPTLGEIYAAQGQFKKAIQVYETLIEKYPEDTERYTQKINELKKKLEESS